MKTFIKFALSLFVSSLYLFASTHIVDVNHPSMCTSGDNSYLTIQDALDNLTNNDEIIICDGIYTESMSLDDSLSGLTIHSFNNEKTAVTIKGGSDLTFELENFSNLTIRDLTITSTGDSAINLIDIRGDVNLTNLDISAKKTVLDIIGVNNGYNLYLNNLSIENGKNGINLKYVKNMTIDTLNFDAIDDDALVIEPKETSSSIHTLTNINMQDIGNNGIEYKSCLINSISISNTIIGSDSNIIEGIGILVDDCDADIFIDGMYIYSEEDGMKLSSEGNYNLKNIDMPITAGDTKFGITIKGSTTSTIDLESIRIGSITPPDHDAISIDTCSDIWANNLILSAKQRGFYSTNCSGKIELLDSQIDSLEESTIHIDESDELIISGTCVAEVSDDIDAIFLGEDVQNALITQNYIPRSTHPDHKGSFGLESESEGNLLVYENCFIGPAQYLVSVAGDSSHTNFDNGGEGNYWNNFDINDGKFIVNASENIFDNYPLITCPIDPVTCSFTPIYQTSNDCGIFENVITSYHSIVSTGNNVEAINTDSIAYPQNQLTGEIICSNNNTPCERNEPPINKLDYSVYVSAKLGTDEGTPSAVLTKIEYGDFDGNFDLTLEPASTYNLNTPVMLFGDVTLGGANTTLSLKAGDYFFNSLTFSGNNPSLVLADSASTRIFIKTDFKVTGNGLNVNLNGNPNHLLVYVRGDIDFSTNGNVRTLNGFFYIEGEAKFDANSANFEVHGGITSEGKISITGNNGKFYQDSDSSNLGYRSCTYSTRIYKGGPFGAWDIIHHNASNPPLDQNISTKIVHKAFTLSIASLDINETFYESKPESDINITIYDQNTSTPISNNLTFDSNNSSLIFQDFNVTSASKDAVVAFTFCSTYEGNETVGSDSFYTLYHHNSCSSYTEECDYETSSSPVWRICSAKDHFAIRPEKFNLEALTLPLKAGTSYTYNFTALDATGLQTNDYNESQGESFSIDINETSSSCNTGTFSPSFENLSFQDGNTSISTHYSEVGKITIKISENDGSEFAFIDDDDTLDTQRFISPYEVNISIIPEHFKIVATLQDYDNSSFTYISQDLNMSSLLDINITAQTEGNSTTLNYNASCYAQTIDMNISYLPLTISPLNALSTLKYFDTNTSLDYNVTINQYMVLTRSPSIFTTDINGTANISLKINFDRNLTKAVNPFTLTINDINVSDANTSFGTENINQDAHYIYGRTNAPRSRFKNNDNQTVYIYYESYCDGTGCDKTLLPSSSKYSDDPRWFINILHTDSKFGTASTVRQKGSSNNVYEVTSPNGIHPDSVIITYDGTKGNPYKTTMENNASSWLIYNKFKSTATRNEFQVEFEKTASSWAGKKTTTVTTDSDSATNVNRRSMW